MKGITLLVGIFLARMVAVPASGQDDLEQRRQRSQRQLDSGVYGLFRFNDGEANVLHSLTQFQGKCQIHMITDPAKQGTITFKFVRDGKELAVVEGHWQSVFRADERTLFFAHFSPTECGCAVAAYDLGSGKEKWRTKLEAVARVPHSSYSNKVTMYYWHTDGREDEEVQIMGRESCGGYIERLDPKTGKQLAHRVYKIGF